MISSKIPTIKVKVINEESMREINLLSDKMQKTFSEITSKIETAKKDMAFIIQQQKERIKEQDGIGEGYKTIREIQKKRDANLQFIDKTLKEIERDHGMKFDFNYIPIIQQDDQKKYSYLAQLLEKILMVFKNLFNIC